MKRLYTTNRVGFVLYFHTVRTNRATIDEIICETIRGTLVSTLDRGFCALVKFSWEWILTYVVRTRTSYPTEPLCIL